jgi:hypothetical protein
MLLLQQCAMRIPNKVYNNTAKFGLYDCVENQSEHALMITTQNILFWTGSKPVV